MGEDTWASLADQFADEAYATVKGYVRTYVMHQQLLEHLPPPPATVLDVGGGAGHQSFPLAQAGYQVTLLDPSPAMLDKARQRLERLPAEARRRVTLLQADGENADGAVDGRRFDGVLCHGVLGYLEQPEPMVGQLCRCAAPGGIVSIMTGNAKAMAVRPAMERRWEDALAVVRRHHRDRRARRAGPRRHGGGTQRADAAREPSSRCAGTGCGCSSTGSSSAAPTLDPTDSAQVGGAGRGRTRGQPARPLPSAQPRLSSRRPQGSELTCKQWTPRSPAPRPGNGRGCCGSAPTTSTWISPGARGRSARSR